MKDYKTAKSVDLTELARVTVALNDAIEERTGERTLTTKMHLHPDGTCTYTGDSPDFSTLVEPCTDYKALENFITKNYIDNK